MSRPSLNLGLSSSPSVHPVRTFTARAGPSHVLPASRRARAGRCETWRSGALEEVVFWIGGDAARGSGEGCDSAWRVAEVNRGYVVSCLVLSCFVLSEKPGTEGGGFSVGRSLAARTVRAEPFVVTCSTLPVEGDRWPSDRADLAHQSTSRPTLPSLP